MKKILFFYLELFLLLGLLSCSTKNIFYGIDAEDIEGPSISISYPVAGATVNGTFTIIGTAKDNGGNEVLKIEVLAEGSGNWTAYRLASGTTNWSITVDSLFTWGGGVATARTLRIKASDTNYKINTNEITVTYTVDNSNPSALGSIDDNNDANGDLYRALNEPSALLNGVVDYQWTNEGAGALDYVISLYRNGAQMGISEIFTNGDSSGVSGTRDFGGITVDYDFPVSGTNSFRFAGTNNNQYYIVATPRDVSANEIKTEYSNAITMDLEPPSIITAPGATVSDGPADFSSSTSVLFTWKDFAENSTYTGAAIKKYEIQACDGVGGSNDCSAAGVWSTTYDAQSNTYILTSGIGTELFADGETVALRVRALDLAGNASDWVYSDGITINSSVNNVGAIGIPSDTNSDGFQNNIIENSAIVQFSWAELTDATQYILQIYELTQGESDDYQVSKTVGAMINGANTGITGVSLNTALGLTTFQFLAQDGRKYYVKVKGYDDAGNESALWSKSGTISVDITSPTAVATVLDTSNGTNYPGQYVASTMVNFSWSGFGDAGFGIESYEVQSCDGVGGTNDCTAAGNWSATQNLGQATNVSTTGYGTETYANGETVALRVRAVDGAGNVSNWVDSDGILVDITPPDATGSTPLITKTGARQGTVSWTDALDAGGSGIDYYVVEVTHSTNRVAYFAVEVDSGKTAASNLIEYPHSLEATVVSSAVISGGNLVYIYDDPTSASDWSTAIIRVYDRAGNVSQTFISDEVNVW